MGDPVLSISCDEPEGTVVRHVYPLIFTPENLQKFYNKAKKFRTLFGREILTVEDFQKIFMRVDSAGQYTLNGLFWVIDDFVGVLYLTDIGDIDALAHYTFFDGRFKGREPLVKAMLTHVFTRFQFLHRLSAEIPTYTPFITRHYAKIFGFKREGSRRAAAKYKDGYFDVLLYGILRAEALSNVEVNPNGSA
jgi:RimJ/RimL family protein N-acetyltransferase